VFLGGLEPVFFSQQKILTWPVRCLGTPDPALRKNCQARAFVSYIFAKIFDQRWILIKVITLSTYISQKSTGRQWNVNSGRVFLIG
jgi:hypothetical protein